MIQLSSIDASGALSALGPFAKFVANKGGPVLEEVIAGKLRDELPANGINAVVTTGELPPISPVNRILFFAGGVIIGAVVVYVIMR